MSARAPARSRSSGTAHRKRKHDKRRVTSPKNGAKGGRPRDKLPADVIERLKALPRVTPKEIRLWNATLLVEVQTLNLEGKISNELAASLRANAGSIDRALPAEPPPKPLDDDDEDPDEDHGADLDDTAAAGGGLRVG